MITVLTAACKAALAWWRYRMALTVTPAERADFTGPIVSVLDGDTLEVLHNQHPERLGHFIKAL
jgi:endonuclease YncB( thermonuclease family)